MGDHEPILYRAGRHGAWGVLRMRAVAVAHLEFGSHLLDETRRPRR